VASRSGQSRKTEVRTRRTHRGNSSPSSKSPYQHECSNASAAGTICATCVDNPPTAFRPFGPRRALKGRVYSAFVQVAQMDTAEKSKGQPGVIGPKVTSQGWAQIFVPRRVQP